jgi:hypothetical protein
VLGAGPGGSTSPLQSSWRLRAVTSGRHIMRWTRAALLAAGLALAVAGCSSPGHPASSGTGPQAAATTQPASSAAKGSPSPHPSSAVQAGASSSRPSGGGQPTTAAGRSSGKTVRLLCQDTSIDMVTAVLGRQPGSAVASTAPIFSPTPSSVLVCVYSSQSSELVHGSSVSGSAERTLLTGLQAGAAGCPATRPLFAVVESGTSPGQAAWVDLADCARVLRPDNTVGQASSAALKIIDAIGGH